MASETDSRTPFEKHLHVHGYHLWGRLALFSRADRSNVCTHFPGPIKGPLHPGGTGSGSDPGGAFATLADRGRLGARGAQGTPSRPGFPPGIGEAAPSLRHRARPSCGVLGICTHSLCSAAAVAVAPRTALRSRRSAIFQMRAPRPPPCQSPLRPALRHAPTSPRPRDVLTPLRPSHVPLPAIPVKSPFLYAPPCPCKPRPPCSANQALWDNKNFPPAEDTNEWLLLERFFS